MDRLFPTSPLFFCSKRHVDIRCTFVVPFQQAGGSELVDGMAFIIHNTVVVVKDHRQRSIKLGNVFKDGGR
jgi:hypothetical protein